jgi:hypothetical protein
MTPEPTLGDAIVRRSDSERHAYEQGFEAGARLILRHWRGGKSADESESLLNGLLVLFVGEQREPSS